MFSKPKFWKNINIISFSLIPISIIYLFISKLLYALQQPKKVKTPVICIGNINIGGAGKTPIAIEVSKILTNLGYKVAFLTRGYGRATSNPIIVNNKKHSYTECGDEPLLLSKFGNVFVNKDRYIGAKDAIRSGADIIIMDDGLQNYSLKKDISLLIISGPEGINNGLLIPAGSLRESFKSAIKKVDAVIIIGKDNHNITKRIPKNKNIFKANIKTFPNNEIKNSSLVAFAGISNPEKFFTSLRDLKYNLLETIHFLDHYPYKEKDIEKLLQIAKKNDSKLITTEKDYVRIPKKYQNKILVLPMEVKLENNDEFISFLNKNLQNFKT